MTESGQRGTGRQDESEKNGNSDKSGPSPDTGTPPEKTGIPAVSGWNRFRRSANPEIELIPMEVGPASVGKRQKSRPKHLHFILPLITIAAFLLFVYGMWRFFWSPEPIAKTVVAQAVVGLLSPDDKGEAIRAIRVKETDIKPFPLLAAKPDVGSVVSPTAINLLVMARDVEANLYDTLMVVSLDPDNGRIHLLNIPRDLYVDYSPEAVALIRKRLPNINSDPGLRKINAAHKLGKLIKYREGSSRFGSPDYDFTADLIEEMFSLSIDDFVYIYPESFKKIVDEFGGVRLDVPYSMRYSDPTQDLKIDLQAGQQLLDGFNAEGFVRFRKGYNSSGKWFEIGDLGRKENQNIFVKAFMEQNLTLGKMGKIISLANRYTEFMETSLTGATKIGDYAQFGTSLIAKKFVTEPVILETRYQKIFGHEQFVLGSGVKNAKSVAEAGTGGSGAGQSAPSDVKPAKATPKPANATTEGGVKVPDPAASPSPSPAASESASPEALASPDASANPGTTASPGPSVIPEATATPAASASPGVTAVPAASASPGATAVPAASASPGATAAPAALASPDAVAASAELANPDATAVSAASETPAPPALATAAVPVP